jgi:hypothetical protein
MAFFILVLDKNGKVVTNKAIVNTSKQLTPGEKRVAMA